MDDSRCATDSPTDLRPLVPLEGGALLLQILMISTEGSLTEITDLKDFLS